jgi:hypothetical protein
MFLKNQYEIWKIMWKMHFKQIEEGHMENVILWRNFNLGAFNSLVHAFTHLAISFG